MLNGFMKNANSDGLAASVVAMTRSGRLFGLTGINTGADQFIQIHDAAEAPSAGATPAVSFKVPSGESFSLDYAPYGRHFVNGIVVCNSSTADTLTAGAADCMIDVQYRED